MIVASFFAPRYEKWSGVNYDTLLRILDHSCKRVGLRHVVISDSERPKLETALFDLPKDLMPAILDGQRQLLEKATEPVLLTGADCILTADPGDLLGDADIAITLGPFADCPMNTGLIIVKDGPKCARVWADALAEKPLRWGEDQTSLYRAVLRSGLKIRELPCQQYNWAPEAPDDSAGMPLIVHFRGPRKAWMPGWYKRFILDGEGKRTPHFSRGVVGATIDSIMENFKANVARDLPWIEPAKQPDRPLCIIGGGPSLAGSLYDIRLRQRIHKGVIWAMNNAWRPLVANKIIPDAIVMMDSRPENIGFLDGAPDCQFLMASMIHPSLLDALQGKNVALWHADQTGYAELEILTTQYKHRPWAIVPGGGTVGLRSMNLAEVMGYRELHLYGMDSSYAGDKHHAYAQPMNDDDKTYKVDVQAIGKSYLCAGWMARQADEFQKFRMELIDRGMRIWAHGEGLIPDLSRHHNRSMTNGRGKTVPDRRSKVQGILAHQPVLGG